MTKRVSAFLLVLALTALSQVRPPRAGIVRDRAGALRPVYGVAGAFVLGDALETGVLSAGFSGATGFAKTARELLVLHDGAIVERIPAPSGPAEFHFEADPGVYFPESGEVWSTKTRRLTPAARPQTRLAAEGDEVALPAGGRVRLPELVLAVEWMSEDWVVARGAEALHAIRAGGGTAAVVRLPEAAQ